MALDLFSPGFVTAPVLDRIQRGERIHDNLPRRRFHAQDKPDRKNLVDDTSPEDITMSEEDGNEKRRLDLRA